MGRAQGRVTDRFGAVFGNRRGLGQKQEELARQIHTLFSHDRGAARRRARLVRWWLENSDRPRELPYFAHFSHAYDDAWRFDKGVKRQQLVDSSCRNDLNSLIARGLCRKVPAANRSQLAGAGRSEVTYELLPMADWPAKHRQVFAAWQMAGCPDWHAPMGSYSPSSSSSSPTP